MPRPEKKSTIGTKLAAFLLVLCTGVGIATLLSLCVFAHPAGDDFGNVRWTNWWHFQQHAYFNWTGRFFSTAIISLNPIHWHSLLGYRLGAAGLILAFSSAVLYFTYRTISACGWASRALYLIIGCSTLLLLLNNLDSLTEGFYWFCGAMSYTLPTILLLAALTSNIHLLTQTTKQPGKRYFVLNSLLLIATVGSNETIIPIAGLAICLLLLHSDLSFQKRRSQFYATLLFVLLFSAVIAIIAPGNFVRLHMSHRLSWDIVPAWLDWTWRYFVAAIFDTAFLLYAAAILFFSRFIAFQKSKTPIIVLFTLPGIVLLLCTFPSFWSMGKQPPYRALNVGYTFFVCTTLPLLLKIGALLQDFDLNRALNKKTLSNSVVILLLFVAGLRLDKHQVHKSNFYIAFHGIAQKIPQQFDAFLEERYALVKASSLDTVFVQSIPQKRGNLLFFSDLNRDSKKFPNPDFAAWLGARNVALLPARNSDTTFIH
ncbi:MAG: hypothetical protein JST36_07360 [Bacteroidetes bacterium]|nr:hypothetical protein [Bacteroidota bacterium]